MATFCLRDAWRHADYENISPESSGHHDHSVDAREGTAAPKRADDASEMAVPGGSGSYQKWMSHGDAIGAAIPIA